MKKLETLLSVGRIRILPRKSVEMRACASDHKQKQQNNGCHFGLVSCCDTKHMLQHKHTHIQLKKRFTKPKGVCTNAKIQDVNKNEDKSLLLLLLLLQDLKQSEPKVNPKIHFQCCCPEREREEENVRASKRTSRKPRST